MKYCPNQECPGLQRYGIESEFRDDREVCSDCRSPLIDGEAPSYHEMPEVEFRDRTVVAHFTYPHEAQVAASFLRSEGIDVSIADENLLSIHTLVSDAAGGVRIMVAPEQVVRARSLLREDRSGNLEQVECEDERGDFEESCPRCGSTPVLRRDFSKWFLVITIILLGIPMLLVRRKKSCGACGHEWRDR